MRINQESPFRITRRQLGHLVLPAIAPALAATNAYAHTQSRDMIAGRFTIFEDKENCWHPQVIRTRKGELLLSFLLGDPPKTMLIRSGDGGQTWSNPTTIYEGSELEGGGGWGLQELSSGRLLMSYFSATPWPKLPCWPPASEPRKIGGWPAKGLNPWGWAPSTSTVSLKALYSDDGGHTWTSTRAIDCSPYLAAIPHGCGRIFEKSKYVYMPVWIWKDAKHDGCAGLLQSSDRGETWSAGPLVAAQNPASNKEYREASIQPLDNQNWIALCRANQPNEYGLRNVVTDLARSSDGGLSWSEPEPAFGALGYPTLTLLPDGSLMAIGTYNAGIRAFLSVNQGQSWAVEHNLYHRDYRDALGTQDVGSPSCVVLNRETMLVAYYASKVQDRLKTQLAATTNRIEGVWLRIAPAGSAKQ